MIDKHPFLESNGSSVPTAEPAYMMIFPVPWRDLLLKRNRGIISLP